MSLNPPAKGIISLALLKSSGAKPVVFASPLSYKAGVLAVVN